MQERHNSSVLTPYPENKLLVVLGKLNVIKMGLHSPQCLPLLTRERPLAGGPSLSWICPFHSVRWRVILFHWPSITWLIVVIWAIPVPQSNLQQIDRQSVIELLEGDFIPLSQYHLVDSCDLSHTSTTVKPATNTQAINNSITEVWFYSTVPVSPGW